MNLIVPTLADERVILKDRFVDVPRLEVMKRYRITWDDCCTSGKFIGTFMGWLLTPNAKDDPPNWPSRAVFVEGHEVDVFGFACEEMT